MNSKEASIKKAIEHTEVPEDHLDRIIEDAFIETKPSKPTKRKKWLIPAAASILLISTSAFTLTSSPALANYMAELPVIGNVFSIFAQGDDDGLLQYERFSAKVGLAQTSNGITISIDQAVYDGTNVTFTYTVDGVDELDSSTRITGFPELLEAEGSTASMDWEVQDDLLVGINAITHLNEDAAQVNVLWEPESIYSDSGEVEGDWKFEFAVDQLKKDPVALDEKVEESGVTVHFTEVTFTDININIAYQQLVDPAILGPLTAVEAELIAQDNLGNVYPVPYNGGTAYGDAVTREDLFWTATMRGLDPQATVLTFYPFAHISDSIGEAERIEFDALEIDLLEGTHQIVQDPVFPSLEEKEEE